MSLFDIAIIVIVILCLTRGIFRGIIKETVSLVGVFAGFYIAGKHHLALGNMLFARIWDTTYAEVVAFLAILFAMILISYAVEEVVDYLLGLKFFSWVDRLVGAGVGISKGVLLASVFLIIFMVYIPRSTQLVDSSRFLPYLELLARKIVVFAPSDIRYAFEDEIDGYRIGRKNHRKIPGSDNANFRKGA